MGRDFAPGALLLLDEPAAGMGAEELARLMDDIRRLRGAGKTVFLIEHTMDLVMGVADRIAVLEGQLEIDSERGAGTTVRAQIPCA